MLVYFTEANRWTVGGWGTGLSNAKVRRHHHSAFDAAPNQISAAMWPGPNTGPEQSA